VHARSRGLGTGSEFVVELPAVSAHVRSPRQDREIDSVPARRILIVDDNRDSADTLGALLGTLGATVSVVYDGRAALDALREFEPDVMILDIGMPEMDGYEVARQVRSTPDQGHVLLIALTGWGQEHDRETSRAAGFDHHMVKPPDLPALRALLNAHPTALSRTD
jgi:CheY-like chemotaxis protein